MGVRVEADTSSPLSPYTRRPSSCAQLGRTARHGHWTPSPHLAFPWGRAPPPAPGLINKQLNNCRIAMLSHVKQLSTQYTPTRYYTTAPRPVPIRTSGRAFSICQQFKPRVDEICSRAFSLVVVPPSICKYCNPCICLKVSQNRLES